jgi:hypothetical protein
MLSFFPSPRDGERANAGEVENFYVESLRGRLLPYTVKTSDPNVPVDKVPVKQMSR